MLLICFSLFAFYSCRKPTKYPVEPAINFVNYSVATTLDSIFHVNQIKEVRLTFSFTDGDADIGLGQGDTLAPYDKNSIYYYNVVATYYEKKNGYFIEMYPKSYRIPPLAQYANNKGIKGNVEIKMDLYTWGSDTVKYDLYIYDRALHKSNIISTPEILLK